MPAKDKTGAQLSDRDQALVDALNGVCKALTAIDKNLSSYLPPANEILLDAGQCWRWQAVGAGGQLLALPLPSATLLTDLIGLDDSIRIVEKNTQRFMKGEEASNVLLTGGRGCGKSTLVRGIFSKYHRRGLRLIETDAAGLALLPALQLLLARRVEKYILYCDDLSFNDSDYLFTRIKSAVDGALTSRGGNMLIYATSNRRNLVAEQYRDNLPALDAQGDIQPLETLDEKIALADRFGIWLSFYEEVELYDKIVSHWLSAFGVKATAALRQAGRNFADQRGSRNGRIARQFALSVKNRLNL